MEEDTHNATEEALSLARNRDLAMTNYGEVINTLTEENKRLIRYMENTSRKIINTKQAITFNEICVRENLLPIYTLNIYIYIHLTLHYRAKLVPKKPRDIGKRDNGSEKQI